MICSGKSEDERTAKPTMNDHAVASVEPSWFDPEGELTVKSELNLEGSEGYATNDGVNYGRERENQPDNILEEDFF